MLPGTHYPPTTETRRTSMLPLEQQQQQQHLRLNTQRTTQESMLPYRAPALSQYRQQPMASFAQHRTEGTRNVKSSAFHSVERPLTSFCDPYGATLPSDVAPPIPQSRNRQDRLYGMEIPGNGGMYSMGQQQMLNDYSPSAADHWRLIGGASGNTIQATPRPPMAAEPHPLPGHPALPFSPIHNQLTAAQQQQQQPTQPYNNSSANYLSGRPLSEAELLMARSRSVEDFFKTPVTSESQLINRHSDGAAMHPSYNHIQNWPGTARGLDVVPGGLPPQTDPSPHNDYVAYRNRHQQQQQHKERKLAYQLRQQQMQMVAERRQQISRVHQAERLRQAKMMPVEQDRCQTPPSQMGGRRTPVSNAHSVIMWLTKHLSPLYHHLEEATANCEEAFEKFRDRSSSRARENARNVVRQVQTLVNAGHKALQVNPNWEQILENLRHQARSVIADGNTLRQRLETQQQNIRVAPDGPLPDPEDVLPMISQARTIPQHPNGAHTIAHNNPYRHLTESPFPRRSDPRKTQGIPPTSRKIILQTAPGVEVMTFVPDETDMVGPEMKGRQQQDKHGNHFKLEKDLRNEPTPMVPSPRAQLPLQEPKKRAYTHSSDPFRTDNVIPNQICNIRRKINPVEKTERVMQPPVSPSTLPKIRIHDQIVPHTTSPKSVNENKDSSDGHVRDEDRKSETQMTKFAEIEALLEEFSEAEPVALGNVESLRCLKEDDEDAWLSDRNLLEKMASNATSSSFTRMSTTRRTFKLDGSPSSSHSTGTSRDQEAVGRTDQTTHELYTVVRRECEKLWKEIEISEPSASIQVIDLRHGSLLVESGGPQTNNESESFDERRHIKLILGPMYPEEAPIISFPTSQRKDLQTARNTSCVCGSQKSAHNTSDYPTDLFST